MQEDDDDFINITALLRMLTHPCNKELNNYTTRNEKCIRIRLRQNITPQWQFIFRDVSLSQISISDSFVIWRQLHLCK